MTKDEIDAEPLSLWEIGYVAMRGETGAITILQRGLTPFKNSLTAASLRCS
jgi:hypothetical protein